ncbi:MAG TPA: efflux RND transporter periplasmic adaptor subunit [Terriglobales bacterium]|jgi:HlyD family secretion protein|nr:efflux RND transporter periplasmic adaptor subunit [Terriglobales bacterium]
MSTAKKIAIGSGIAVVVLAIAGIAVHQARKGIVTVQTDKAARQDLASIVSASGEIKPKTYVNIGANAFGKITRLYVKEGDRVKKGQLLAQLENVQSSADVNATQAGLEAARTDAVAAEAALNTSMADLNRAQSDYERAQLDWTRAQGLYKESLIAKSEYDSQKAAWQTAQAGLAQAQARVAQAKAQKDSADRHISQNAANLTHATDVLQKTSYAAPYDGMITNLPVREGETVVIGIQNSPGSTLMTLADMSVITAEVRVDETDIVNVRLGQPAEVSIDAIPKKTFRAVVTEIGDNAIVRSTGVSTSQQTSASQEAKDFKVVVTLQEAPDNLRPGLSATAKVTTATRSQVLTIPIQALTVRTRGELKASNTESNAVQAAAPQNNASNRTGDDKEEVQGVFVIRDRKAVFLPVETGITGTTDIEVLKGLKAGDEIVTGSYKVLRTLRPGASVKIDNTAPEKKEDES